MPQERGAARRTAVAEGPGPSRRVRRVPPETGSYAHSYTPGSDRANGRARISRLTSRFRPGPVHLTAGQLGGRLGRVDEDEEQWVAVLEYRNTAKRPSAMEQLRA
ncbi:hypothetical protein GCM10009759_37430 [Kitasatospora saccharophila]|uniref:Uncharacterized protein n=1 Tax=Kitasatospora saccharophila TaxID=407973 RepID=A0ABN2X194_9ACTN